MSVVLVRIDDRLVHGQVVEGWLRALRVNHVVVANDSVVADETQKALYFLAVPQGLRLSCLTVNEAAEAWKTTNWGDEKVLVLLSNAQDVLRLAQSGAPVRTVNVGGLHYREGRIQVLRAVSLADADVASFRALLAMGVSLEARPLPLDEPVDLVPVLDRWDDSRQAHKEIPR